MARPARSPYGNYGHAILTASAMRTPDQVALTYRGERSFTYDQLNRNVNRRANALIAAGVTPGTRVAALLNETLQVAEVYLAQAKIGAVTAALNPYWPVETLRDVVAASGCTVFVHDATVAPRGRGHQAGAAAGDDLDRRTGAAGGVRRGAAARRVLRRPARALLHLGHHRAAQGRRAHPRIVAGHRPDLAGRAARP
ncbi:hypothetical protein GCM10020001_069660 [Nonomuraea salmonea]